MLRKILSGQRFDNIAAATQEWFETLITKWIKNAIEKIKSKENSPSFFVFSDDTEWVKENLGDLFSNLPVEFISGNTQEEDLWLMSLAKHHIIANSSFSWWGAWLATSENQMVISPTPWFDIPQRHTSDPSLESWIRVRK